MLCGGLLKIGLERGDRLGIFLPNIAEWALMFYACSKLGIIVVNVNPAYRKSELMYVFLKVLNNNINVPSI